MRNLIIVYFTTIMLCPIFGFSSTQQDSLTVIFFGNTKGEKYKVFWSGKLIFSFKGSGSYKYSFKIPKDTGAWKARGYIEEIYVYRKGRFALKYKEVGFTSGFENKKFLVIWRNPALKNRASIQPSWSDKEPRQIPDI